MQFARTSKLSYTLYTALTVCLLALAVRFRGTESEMPPGFLDQQQREYIWNVEHHVLLLKKHGLKPLANDLVNRDLSAVGRVLAEDFVATAAEAPDLEQRTSWGQISIYSQVEADSEILGREAFLRRLAKERGRFTGIPRVEWNVGNAGPLDRGQWAGLWRVHVELRLAGQSTMGLAELSAQMTLDIQLPTEEHLAAGGWWRRCVWESTDWTESREPLFHEVARERGIHVSRLYDNWTCDTKLANNTGGLYVFDYDGDHRLDLLVTDYHSNILYRGVAGGRFEDVTEQAGLNDTVTGGIGAVAGDLDGDGWIDLILDTRVYRNQLGQRFVEITSKSNLRLLIGASGVSLLDYDRDGLLDLYVTNWGAQLGRGWADDRTARPSRNQLWHNLGDWQFEEVAERAGATGDDRAVFAAAVCDANDDLWPDLYVPNELGRGLLLTNRQDGTFDGSPLTDGPGDHGSMGISVGDVDRNGHVDLYVSNMFSKSGRRVISNLRPGTFSGSLQAKLDQSFATGASFTSTVGVTEPGRRSKQLGRDLALIGSVGLMVRPWPT